METEKIASISLIIISFALGLYAYPMLPESVASHWGLEGEVNGYLPAFWGAFLIPLLSAGLFTLFLVIPIIDPLRANIEGFRADYHRFILVMALFLSLVHIQMLLWNLGTQISFNLTMPILMGGLFLLLGDMLGRVKRNWFIGIRTPWTMSNDIVWEKTHKFGGKAFKAAGILAVVSVILPAYAFIIVIGLVIVAALGASAYSYFAYAELMKSGKKPLRIQKEKSMAE
ncbi:SdpI family protein [Candidatus Micrarchaeota archaeon]|nr:SdpI family protein [Candidatus Micrarchaeota archaeon]